MKERTTMEEEDREKKIKGPSMKKTGKERRAMEEEEETRKEKDHR